MNTSEFSKFDVADYLDNEEVIQDYLNGCLELNEPKVFIAALNNVARAKGIANISKKTGLGRESIYKSLANGANPRFETIMKILDGLGASIRINNK
jgi:probable addiction module antidote protein